MQIGQARANLPNNGAAKETGDIYGIKIDITEVSLYKMSQWKAKTKKEIEK